MVIDFLLNLLGSDLFGLGVGEFLPRICIQCNKCGESFSLNDVRTLAMTLSKWCESHGYDDEKNRFWIESQTEMSKEYSIMICPVCGNTHPVNINSMLVSLEDNISCYREYKELEIKKIKEDKV